MSRLYPALEVRWPEPSPGELIEHLLAVLDDERPTAVDERETSVVVYFGTAEARDRAIGLACALVPAANVRALSVSDESWAERSQASLGAVRVGRIVLTPPWASDDLPGRDLDSRANPDIAVAMGPDIVITIVPSMGFGTGHHASTRLCLELLQASPLNGRQVLDAGTGSGALAIAASRLGASRVLAVDSDPDAVQSARENVVINQAERIELRVQELGDGAGELDSDGPFDVITANLTGALLQRFAATLSGLLASGGTLIVSGLQEHEEREVVGALTRSGLTLSARSADESWVGLALTRA